MNAVGGIYQQRREKGDEVCGGSLWHTAVECDDFSCKLSQDQEWVGGWFHSLNQSNDVLQFFLHLYQMCCFFRHKQKLRKFSQELLSFMLHYTHSSCQQSTFLLFFGIVMQQIGLRSEWK